MLHLLLVYYYIWPPFRLGFDYLIEADLLRFMLVCDLVLDLCWMLNIFISFFQIRDFNRLQSDEIHFRRVSGEYIK